MSVKVDLTFVDENDFQKRGKWFFWSDNSSWETCSTISMDTNDSLAGISELNGARESETNREGDSSWHDDSDVSDQQSDDDHTEEAWTSLGNRKEKRNSEKGKVSSETQKGRRAKGKSVRKKASNNKNNNAKGKPREARGKTKGKALTLKELDDLVKMLDEKRPMCWNFVSEELTKHTVNLLTKFSTIKYNELRDLVLHMYSLYTKFVLEISKDVKNERKAHLYVRWMRSLTSFLDGSSENSNVCSAVFAELLMCQIK